MTLCPELVERAVFEDLSVEVVGEKITTEKDVHVRGFIFKPDKGIEDIEGLISAYLKKNNVTFEKSCKNDLADWVEDELCKILTFVL
ncbi:MAG: hypothetical protein PF572_05355 [Patescibacteria group bacterium]|jgi:uncharacterized protein YukJ|nr:hypothetical protein [Patescibacteria group bacterium]